MEQIFTFAKFHYEIDMSSGINDIIQAHDILMSERCQNIYLFLNGFYNILRNDTFLIIRFARDNMTGFLVNYSFHFSKGALSQLQTHLKVTEFEYLVKLLFTLLNRFLTCNTFFFLSSFPIAFS